MALSLVTQFVGTPHKKGRFSQHSKSIVSYKRALSYRSPVCTYTTDPPRRSANYKPSIWHDDFIQSLTIDPHVDNKSRVNKLKEEVRQLMKNESLDTVNKLEIIDAMQQLGVAYHFKNEINDIFHVLCKSLNVTCIEMKDDIYATSLLFRLLRSQGLQISEVIFDKFKDENGNFMTTLGNNTRGMLNLYEASYLAKEGEETLSNAKHFSRKLLCEFLTSSPYPNSWLMELPLRWRMTRLHARWFIEAYKRDENMRPNLLELAILDFNLVQNIYKKEIKNLSRWWCDLRLKEELPFCRDRLMESYLWAVGWDFEPNLNLCREVNTKATCLIAAIDDMYDIYGGFDELELFTDAVERWDKSAMTNLPEYMKVIFCALLNTTEDICFVVMRNTGLSVFPFLKKVWIDLCKSYIIEAKWYKINHVPTVEEYLDNGWISIASHVILSHSYCVNPNLTAEDLDCFNKYPNILRWSSMITRLCNDLATTKAEVERGDVTKSIKCYMHHEGVGEIEARKKIEELIVRVHELGPCTRLIRVIGWV